MYDKELMREILTPPSKSLKRRERIHIILL